MVFEEVVIWCVHVKGELSEMKELGNIQGRSRWKSRGCGFGISEYICFFCFLRHLNTSPKDDSCPHILIGSFLDYSHIPE